MANKELGTGAITDATALTGIERFHVKQGGNSRDATINQLKDFLISQREETKVTKSGDQAVATTAATPVSWDQETLDEGNWHDNVTNNARITPGEGIFDAVAVLGFTGLTSALTSVYVRRYNSSDVLQETVAESTSDHSNDHYITVTPINIRCSAGDYLQVEVESADSSYSVVASGAYFLVRRAMLEPTSLGFTGARVELTANEALSVGTDVVAWDTAVFDTHTFYDGANPTRLTAPENGYYLIVAGLETAVVAQNFTLQTFITVDGGAYPGIGASHQAYVAESSTNKAVSVATITFLSAGQYVELKTIQDSSGSINADANSASFFSMARINPGGGGGGGGSLSWMEANFQSVTHTSNTNLLLTLNTPTVDTDGYYDAGNPTRINAPFTGKYRVTFMIFEGFADSSIFFQSSVNLNRGGSTTFFNDLEALRMDRFDADTGFSKPGSYNATGVLSLNEGDYIELVIYQLGVNRTIGAISVVQIEFLGT